MKAPKSYVYQLTYNGKSFTYFSIYDNTLMHGIRSNIAQNQKVSFDNLMNKKEDELTLIPVPLNTIPLTDFINSREGKNDYIVIDIRGVASCNSREYERFQALFEHYSTIYILSSNRRNAAHIRGLFSSKHFHIVDIREDDMLQMFAVTAVEKADELLFENADNIEETINRCLNEKLFDCIKEENEDRQQILSSNVHANRYINMRLLFKQNETAVLMTTQLIHLISNEIAESDFDAFVCASITGACIASALSTFIKKPVLFLRNIGPDMTTEDEHIVKRIYPHKRYVYIFDFMCLGTEYQRIKLVCALRKSKIVKSFGVSCYKRPARHPEDERSIMTLFHINDYITDYFSCTV